MAEITNKYNQHLAAYTNPLQEKLLEMEHSAEVMSQGKTIEVLINLVHTDAIKDVESLLQSVQVFSGHLSIGEESDGE